MAAPGFSVSRSSWKPGKAACISYYQLHKHTKRRNIMLKHLTALAVVAFFVALGFCSPVQAANESAGIDSVTFQVHMGALIQTGAFNPATDTVVIRGDFQVMAGDTGHYGSSGNQNWGGIAFMMAQSGSNDSIYTLMVPFPDTAATKTINFKYVVINAANSYGDSVTNGGMWESVNNHTYTITSASSQTIPLTYFNNQMPGVVATVNITFQVDMTKMIAQGFNSAVDSVYVVGSVSPLNWGYHAGNVMSASFADPNIYEVTIPFSYVIGNRVDFKLFGAGADPFSNGGWESGDNHFFAFPKADTTVLWTPNLNVTIPSTEPTTVVFHLDMNNAYDGINYQPITNVTGVWITGSVRPLNWPPSGWPLADTVDESSAIDTMAQLHKMYDDGTHGDSVANDNKWTLTLTFSQGVSSYVEYKFGAKFAGYDTLTIGTVVSNGSLIDNECRTGVNHTMTLSGSNMKVYNHFGDMDPGNPGTTGIKHGPDGLPAKFALSQNYPNPFNPTTQINYSVPRNSFVTLKVYNVLGQEVATLYSGMQKAGNYIADFNASRLASGVYFYSLKAANFSSVKKMMLLK